MLYRHKYSQRHAYSHYNSNQSNKWIRSYTSRCNGEIETRDNAFYAIKKLHTTEWNGIVQDINLRKDQAFERMKQSVEMGVDPRIAWETEILDDPNSAGDFWGYREVRNRLHAVRSHGGMPQLPETKEEIYEHLTGSQLEKSYYGSIFFKDNHEMDMPESIEDLNNQI